MLPRWGAVVCTADRAHPHRRERGAPERVAGIKLLTVPTPRRQAHARAHRPRGLGLGRRAPRPAARRVDHADHRARHGLHARRDPRDRRPRPLARHDAAHGRRAHLERGRRPRACRSAPSPPTPASTCSRFGGTKNGLMFGEAVVVLNPRGIRGPASTCASSNMQLASKMRFVSAQLIALLEGDLWHALGRARQRHGGAAALRRRGASPTACTRSRLQPGDPGERRVRDRCPPAWPTGCASASASTTGTPRRARCAGCARSTPPRPTSTRSSRRSLRELRRTRHSVTLDDLMRSAHSWNGCRAAHPPLEEGAPDRTQWKRPS